MPLNQTSGNATADSFGGGVAAVPNYIEDVFSTYLYTGNASTQTITNNIDLSTKGGLTWIKSRAGTYGAYDNMLFDTARGAGYSIQSNNTEPNSYFINTLSSFNTNGFSLGSDGNWLSVNQSGTTYASWTFRKQPKFFDVVTYTGTGVARTIAHSLGSAPGCIIIKRTDTAGYDWAVYHRSLTTPSIYKLALDTTAAQAGPNSIYWNSTDPTSTVFSLGTWGDVNASGGSYVAYLFAHNAGGFGLTGTDNVISCGSMTTDGVGLASVTLGYEPQFLLTKRTDGAGNWNMVDNMRGFVSGTAGAGASDDYLLYPNLTTVETNDHIARPNATGFDFVDPSSASSTAYIYIAIRRGLMKTPTDATKVFQPVAYTGTNVDNRLVDTGIVTDMTMARIRATTSAGGFYTADRLRGNYFLGTVVTDAEATDADSFMTPTSGFGNSFSAMNGFGVGNDITRKLNNSGTTQLAYAFRRAAGFFDEVCYTGTGANRTVTHNLGVTPELMIVKRRDGVINWPVYHLSLGATKFMYLNLTNSFDTASTVWNNTEPTSTQFTVSTSSAVNASGGNYVAYLFATCAGVSKVGSYTGTGATQTISCGFTGGARFVLIKRTDASGDWFVFDTARGMVDGTDPYLQLSSTAAEVNNNHVYTTTGGFQLVSASSGFNASGGTYIYLAIA